MSDWTDDDLNELLGNEGNDNSTIKALRAKIKADNDNMKELRQEVASLRATQREAVVVGTLKSAGLNPAVAKFYQGESDPTAVQAWVQENASLFGANPNPAPQSENETPSPLGGMPPATQAELRQSALTPNEQVDYSRMLNAGVDGVPPSNYNDIMGALSSATTNEDLMAAIGRFQ